MAIVRAPQPIDPMAPDEKPNLHKLVADKATRFLMRGHNCALGAIEFTGGWHSEHVDGFCIRHGFFFVVESKVSRADFLADAKKSFRKNPEEGVGNYRYYACPEGLIKPEELPPKWGLIYVNMQNGRCSMPVGYGWSKYNGETTKRVGSWEKKMVQWRDEEPREVEVPEVGGIETFKHFRFEKTNHRAELGFVIALAQRHKNRQFMGNIL